MVSIRYFCGVGEFCRLKSSPRGALVSNNDTGTAAMPKAMQQTRSGIQAMRRMTRVTWEPSQLAYRAEPVIAHRRGRNRMWRTREPRLEARQTLRMLGKTPF